MKVSTDPAIPPSPSMPPTAENPGRGRTVFILLALVVVIGGGFLIASRRSEHKAEVEAPRMVVENGALSLAADAPQRKYLDISVAARSAPLPPVPAPARVMVDESRAAPLYSPLPGRVEIVNVQLGQEVKPGDKLVAIRSSNLPELGREVESAKAALAVKKNMVERVRDLVQLKAVPQKDLIAADQELHETELNLKAAEGKRKSLRLGALDDSGLFWITASRRGTVVERRALVGMEVGPDRAEALIQVADLSEVIVVADVLETDVVGLAVGQEAEVSDAAVGGTPVRGKIEYVAAFVDPVRRTVAVRVRVPNGDHRLRPNAFAQVTFGIGGAPRIIVPSEAVVTDDQKAVVFVQDKGVSNTTRLQRREVRVGRVRDGKTEILSGLSEGENFVSKGALLVLNTLDLAH